LEVKEYEEACFYEDVLHPMMQHMTA